MPYSPNYHFIVDHVIECCGAGARVLDYGCGEGELVEMGRARGLDMVGADVFQLDDDHRVETLTATGKLGTVLFHMADGRLPFADASFDAICSNQVIEHVTDLELAVSEIARVLRRGGVFITVNPSVEVWREGHCGVAFAHWFQRTPRLQRAYLHAARRLGFGFHKEGRAPRSWAAEFTDYLQRFTAYRPETVLLDTYRRYIGPVRRMEPELAAHRWPRTSRLPRAIRRLLVSRLANMVCVARKGGGTAAARRLH